MLSGYMLRYDGDDGAGGSGESANGGGEGNPTGQKVRSRHLTIFFQTRNIRQSLTEECLRLLKLPNPNGRVNRIALLMRKSTLQ